MHKIVEIICARNNEWFDTDGECTSSAPAAYDTIRTFLRDTDTKPSDYDLILTGDLGIIGKSVVSDAFHDDGIELGNQYDDCGVLIFDEKKQDTHAGGSGCGCSASVLCGYVLPGFKEGKWSKVLFCATGALLSPLTTQQGESIPSVAHLLCISRTRE